MRVIRVFAGTAAAAAAFLTGTAIAAAPVIKNGGFETGDFSGWAAKGGSKVNWFVYKPATSMGFPDPPVGKFAAGVGEDGPSTPTLTQSFKVPKHATLKLITAYNNEASDFATPPDLNAERDDPTPNQQYRIDVMRAGAPRLSLDPGDVLKNVFRTKVGDPNSSPGYMKESVDLSKLAGEKVTLRFAVANNQNQLQIVVDGVKIKTG